MREGVTRFQAHHKKMPPARTPLAYALCDARQRLVAMGVVGADATRYDGVGFGNVSARVADDAFLISGTQTGALKTLCPEHLSLVERSRSHTNEVWSSGPLRPSSESMTHAVVYEARPGVHAVLHGHDPALWRYGRLPETPADVEYGTPEMANAVRALLQEQPDCTAFAMAGHEDGVVIVDATLDAALATFVLLHEAATEAMRAAP